MSQYNDSGRKAFTATSAITPHSRVKLTSASGSHVELAGSGEAFIGFSDEQTYATGDTVNVLLKSPSATVKGVAAEAFAAGASLYGGASGKVQDTASGNLIGTAIQAATADGDVVEILLDNGVSGTFDGSGTAIADAATKGAVVITFAKEGITDAQTAVVVATCATKVKIIDWGIVSRDTTAANVTLYNGSNAASSAMAKGTADAAIVRGATLIAAQDEIAAGGTIKIGASAAAAFDVWVLAYRIA